MNHDELLSYYASPGVFTSVEGQIDEIPDDVASVEDIGQAAVFLCQADNITGESINVTGGSEMG